MTEISKPDRRSVRTRKRLRNALALETLEVGLDSVTVSNLTERADINRRTFYTHYKDVPDMVEHCEQECIDELAALLDSVVDTSLDDLFAAMRNGEAYPGAQVIFDFIKENATFMRAMLGPKGDGHMGLKLKEIIWDHVRFRFLHGIDSRVLGPIFDYYVEYNISAILGVILRWLNNDMKESSEDMAKIVTFIMFVRPGDLYGHPLDAQTFTLFNFADLAMEEFNE
ncbi:MAG: TetR-like C-terminal domain-containing protein [Coriobacteriia bacterium]|nr:TetR-like C-terminal domain-containing protein [Coriobacteriia bacterium]